MPSLPKSYIKKWGVTKLAWKKFRANALSVSRHKPRRKNNPKKRNVRRNMPRRKNRKGGKSITRTAFKFIRLAALVAPGASEMLIHKGNIQKGIGGAIGLYTGFDLNQRNFDASRLTRGWGPYVLASIITHGIPKLTSIIRRL